MTVLGYNQQTLGCGKCSNTNNPVLQQINYKGEKREDEKTKDQKILKKYCILNNHILWIFFESWFKWKTVKKKWHSRDNWKLEGWQDIWCCKGIILVF